jgi:hypothetical protein
MTETTYTPGPWKIDTRTGLVIWGNPGSVCRIPIGDCRTPAKLREADANAHMIAAAPDMLMALKHAQQALAQSSVEKFEIDGKQAGEVVRAAIAKAMGLS